MKQLIIVRGPSGYGKSTYARSTGFKHFETDNYFIKNGVYTFDPSKIRQAHEWNQNEVRKAMETGIDIVVSNTFTKIWEMKAYLDFAKQFGYDVKVVRMTKKWGNVHGVPEAKVAEMEARMESYPGEILQG